MVGFGKKPISVDWNANINFIYQDEPKGLAHTILVAEDFLDDEFVMYLGDNILREGIVEHANTFKANNYDASIMLIEVDNPQEFGVADIKLRGGRFGSDGWCKAYKCRKYC